MEEETYTIYGCTRPIEGQDNSTHSSTLGGPTHCYAKLVKSGKLIEAYSYFQNVGPYREEVVTGNCQVAKEKATWQDWEHMKETMTTFKQQDYSLTSQNC